MNKYTFAIACGLAVLAIAAATSISDVREEIRDYQKRGACQRADLDFNGKVNLVDLRMINGDPTSGDGGFFGRSDYPFWYDQDGDKLISILDICRVAGLNGRTC